MAAVGEPPIEWVPAESRWWVFRFVIPAIVLGLTIIMGFVLWSTAPTLPETTAGYLAVQAFLLGMVFAAFYVMYAFPSVRRIGFSPEWLIVDVGLRKFKYRWDDLHGVTRTQVTRFRWYEVSSVSRTRISVGSGFPSYTVTLSPQQGDRLARFLRIP